MAKMPMVHSEGVKLASSWTDALSKATSYIFGVAITGGNTVFSTVIPKDMVGSATKSFCTGYPYSSSNTYVASFDVSTASGTCTIYKNSVAQSTTTTWYYD